MLLNPIRILRNIVVKYPVISALYISAKFDFSLKTRLLSKSLNFSLYLSHLRQATRYSEQYRLKG